MVLSALLLLAPFAWNASGGNNSTALDRGYAAMYNLNFSGAHQDFNEWEQAYPKDPLGPTSAAAAYLFSEFERLHVLESEFFTDDAKFTQREHELKPDLAARAAFESSLSHGQALAREVLAHSPNDENALFASVLGQGLQADYLALVEKRNFAGLSEMKGSRELAERLINLHPQCYDAYLAVGVENYMLSLKTAAMRWILRIGGAQTDKQAGIERLKLTAEKGHYLLPYARLLLAVAALRDNDRATARANLTWLSSTFPGNQLYRVELQKIR